MSTFYWSNERRKIKTKPLPLVDQPLLREISHRESEPNPCQGCYQKWLVHVVRFIYGICLIVFGVMLAFIYKKYLLKDLLVLGLLLIVGGIVIIVISGILTMLEIRHQKHARDAGDEPEVKPKLLKGHSPAVSIHSVCPDKPKNKEDKSPGERNSGSSGCSEESCDQTNV